MPCSQNPLSSTSASSASSDISGGPSGSFVIGHLVACVVASITCYIPVSYLWALFEDPHAPGSCSGEIAFFRWNGFANMLLIYWYLFYRSRWSDGFVRAGDRNCCWRGFFGRWIVRRHLLLNSVLISKNVTSPIASASSPSSASYPWLRRLHRPDLHPDPLVYMTFCQARDRDCLRLPAHAATPAASPWLWRLAQGQEQPQPTSELFWGPSSQLARRRSRSCTCELRCQMPLVVIPSLKPRRAFRTGRECLSVFGGRQCGAIAFRVG
ncbi:hypothetical protein BDW71DRAFT_136811 [Aspergillus fruticulosus]